jgi:hypothetical protein
VFIRIILIFGGTCGSEESRMTRLTACGLDVDATGSFRISLSLSGRAISGVSTRVSGLFTRGGLFSMLAGGMSSGWSG